MTAWICCFLTIRYQNTLRRLGFVRAGERAVRDGMNALDLMIVRDGCRKR